MTLVIAMSATAAAGSNGLTTYTGLIMCAQKMKSRIGCSQPMRTRSAQTTCQPPINAPITNPTLLGLVTAGCSKLRLCLLVCRKKPALGTRWGIDQKPV